MLQHNAVAKVVQLAAVTAFVFFFFFLITHALHQHQQLKPPAAGNASTSCFPHERDALLAFKRGITNDTANLLASWRPGQDCCRWAGVTCSSGSTGHVVMLDLNSETSPSALVGEISPSLLSLELLEYLDLSMNSLDGPNGTVPEFLGAMKNLRHLDLSYVPFTGRLPDALGNLSKLEYLDLSATSLSGSVPPQLGNLSNLRYLDLSWMQNAYTEDVSWLTRLQVLEYLDMSNVNLSTVAEFPVTANMIPSLQFMILVNCSLPSANQSMTHLNLTELEELNLSGNYFGHSIASSWFWKLTGIKNLGLASTYLHGPFPVALGGMLSLRNLEFDNNGNMATMTVDLRRLCELETFSIDGGLSSGNITELVEKLPHCSSNNLVLLSSAGNKMTGTLPKTVEHLTGLRSLDLSNNSISGTIPAEIQNFTSLETLYLRSNRLSGQIPLLPGSLMTLDISTNFLSGHLPQEFGSPNLEFLILSSNNITGQVPVSVCNSQNMQFLDLSNNHFNGELPHCSQVQNIVFFLLGNNSFSGTFPSWMQSFSSLVFLDLSWNKLYGRIPKWIGELVNLRFLQLSHNMLSGDIPTNITNLRGLQYLNLAANNISGSIPLSLSKLLEMTLDYPTRSEKDSNYGVVDDNPLEILSLVMKHEVLKYGLHGIIDLVGIDLSLNYLSGQIPDEITSLDRLSNLNMSWNYLSGRIPENTGSMKSLESLDLSRNKISSEIPPSLSDLTYLSYLDLSYNNLSGTIPSGRQLDTLYTENPSMYTGNTGLCGPPIERICSSHNNTPDHGSLRGSEKSSNSVFFYYGLGSGFVAGHWIVFCALLFKKSWRIPYFSLADKVYVRLVVTWGRIARRNPTTEVHWEEMYE